MIQERAESLSGDCAGPAPAGGSSAARLLRDWGALLDEPDPKPGKLRLRGGAPRMPWQAERTAADARDDAHDPEAPGFGIRFARCFVAACRRGVISRRRKRGLLRQHRDGMKWIRHAIRYLEREGNGLADGGGLLSPPQRAVRDAFGIDCDPNHRGLVRRLLIAHGAEVARVAQALRLDSAAVEAYQALFFDVRDRQQHPFRFVAALGDSPLVSSRDAAAGDLPPLWEFASMSLPGALLSCGLGGRDGAPGILNGVADSGEARRLESAARRVLMAPGGFDLDSKVVAKALMKYEAMEAELRKEKPVSLAAGLNKLIESMRAIPSFETESLDEDGEPSRTGGCEHPDDAGIPAGQDLAEMPSRFREAFQIIAELNMTDPAILPDTREYLPLTAADLRRVRDLWREYQQIPAALAGPSARHKPPILEPLWEKSLRADLPVDVWERTRAGELPPEMKAPDFGWQLARTAAECGLQAQLPVDDAFHWIRLAAQDLDPAGKACAEGASRRALRMAMDLHRRPAARHLLQAALLTRDADLGEVAAFLALDPPVVAAYATLFFNVPGRAGENGFRQRVIQRFVSDHDRWNKNQPEPKQGMAGPLRKAPELTLEQLQWLLGFKSPGEDPRDAARMLMGHLSGLAAGREMHQSWDDEGPRKPRRSAGRGSKAFEAVLAAADGMMDASNFGVAAALGGMGPMLEEKLRKARNASLHSMRLQMFIDSGLTEEESVEKIQVAKEQRRAEERRRMENQKRSNHG